MSPLRFHTEEIEVTSDLISLAPSGAGLIWLRGGTGIVGWGEAARLDIDEVDPFSAAGRWVDELFQDAEISGVTGPPGVGPVAFTSFAFDPSTHPSVVIVPATMVARIGDRAWRTSVAGAEAPERVAEIAPEKIRYGGASVDEVAWLEAVDRAVGKIKAGSLDKVVLARDLMVWSKEPLDQRVLCRRLAERFPGCHTFAVDGLIGASPEPLLTRTGSEITSLTLAGSAARGSDEASDDALGEGMLRSPKDLDEHRLAVDSVRTAFSDVCSDMEIDEEPHLLKLANVQHLASGARGTVLPEVSTFEVLARLHPTAAVGGTPTREAIEMIRELEAMDRGCYAGPVGWIDPRGDCEFAIALRCAELSGSRARLFAGNGIVAGSIPEAELEETRVKLRAMRSALGDPS